MKAWLIMPGVIAFIIGITVWSVLRAIRNESGCGPCSGCCGGCAPKKPDSSACEGMDLWERALLRNYRRNGESSQRC